MWSACRQVTLLMPGLGCTSLTMVADHVEHCKRLVERQAATLVLERM